MATTRKEIQEWLDSGIAMGTKFMIVVCDSFDHEDYPVYADTTEEFDGKYAKHNGQNMQRIMEVYDLSQPLDIQLTTKRSWFFPSDSKYRLSN
jgi:hypothetical protein